MVGAWCLPISSGMLEPSGTERHWRSLLVVCLPPAPALQLARLEEQLAIKEAECKLLARTVASATSDGAGSVPAEQMRAMWNVSDAGLLERVHDENTALRARNQKLVYGAAFLTIEKRKGLVARIHGCPLAPGVRRSKLEMSEELCTRTKAEMAKVAAEVDRLAKANEQARAFMHALTRLRLRLRHSSRTRLLR